MKTYKEAGVNIELANQAVEDIKGIVKSTHNTQVLSSIGSFAALYALPKYEEPILVSCTDGVGTKLKLAIDLNILDTLGIDLVAMNVNDMLCLGAKPLFFLDYIACHKLVPKQTTALIEGMVQGCKQAGCALIGGEMAEMNDLYQKNDFDLAGFAVGVVEKQAIIDGQKIKPGNYIYALAASGIHSNGFSLVRKVLTPDKCKEYGVPLKNLLAPTKIYVKEVLDLIANYDITSIAHITGGGIQENLARVLNKQVDALITKNQIRVLPIFDVIQQAGQIEEEEMYKVFNMGVGMIIISQDKLPTSSALYQIGIIEAGTGEARFV
jgi:phosphoribosylformylglycinamidine cyclo-ligase